MEAQQLSNEPAVMEPEPATTNKRLRTAAACPYSIARQPRTSLHPSSSLLPSLVVLTAGPLFESIVQLVPLRTKLLQLTRISRSFAPLTPRCFRLDHVNLSVASLDALTRSPCLRLLLSHLPSIHYSASVHQDVQHLTPLGCLRLPDSPPLFLSQLRCYSLDLGFEAHHREGDEEVGREGKGEADGKREEQGSELVLSGASQLLACLSIRCTQLTSSSLRSSSARFDPHSHLLACLQRLPHLTALQISGCDWGYGSHFDIAGRTLTSLLALPLHYLDLSRCSMEVEYGNERMEPVRHDGATPPPPPPSADTLTTLLPPSWTVLPQLDRLQGQLRTLYIGVDEEPDELSQTFSWQYACVFGFVGGQRERSSCSRTAAAT